MVYKEAGFRFWQLLTDNNNDNNQIINQYPWNQLIKEKEENKSVTVSCWLWGSHAEFQICTNTALVWSRYKVWQVAPEITAALIQYKSPHPL